MARSRLEAESEATLEHSVYDPLYCRKPELDKINCLAEEQRRFRYIYDFIAGKKTGSEMVD